MWKKCHRLDEEKKFPYFNSDCYTEDLLDLHDIQIQKWKSYYEQNFRLLNLIERHKELWDKVCFSFSFHDKNIFFECLNICM